MANNEWETGVTDDWELDTEGLDTETVDSNAGQVDKEGWYHFEVADVVDELDTVSNSGNEKSPCVRFDLLVLENVEGQSPAGSRHFHRVYLAGKGGTPLSIGGRKMAAKFGLRLGLLVELERIGIVDAETKGKPNTATWHRAKGAQVVARIVKESDPKYGDKYQIPFNEVFTPSDSRVEKVPKNADALALIGKSVAAAAGNGEEAKSAAAQVSAPQGATAGGLDDLSDL